MTTKKLQGIRDRIAALQNERLALQSQPKSAAEVAQEVTARVEAAHAAGTEALANELQFVAAGSGGDPFKLHAMHGQVDVAPLLVAMLGKDAVLAAMLATLDRIPTGIPTEERNARVAAIDAELETLQFEEGDLVFSLDVDPRADADPKYMLMVPA